MKILLIEDNPADIFIARRALEAGEWISELYVARDGQEALDYLHREGKFTELGQAPRPDLIFLDLNLPKVNGTEVLSRIKEDPGLCSIPVIVLTTSDREEDIRVVYQMGANTYIQKPVEFEQFTQAVNVVRDYWTQVAKLPPNTPLDVVEQSGC